MFPTDFVSLCLERLCLVFPSPSLSLSRHFVFLKITPSLSLYLCWERIRFPIFVNCSWTLLLFSCCYLLLTAGMWNRGGGGGVARHDSTTTTTTSTSSLPPSVLCFRFQLTSTVSVLSLHLLTGASCVRPSCCINQGSVFRCVAVIVFLSHVDTWWITQNINTQCAI